MDFFRALATQHGGSEEAFAALAGAAPSQQFYAADEVARTVLFLASEESSHLSGVELVVDRGQTAGPRSAPPPAADGTSDGQSGQSRSRCAISRRNRITTQRGPLPQKRYSRH